MREFCKDDRSEILFRSLILVCLLLAITMGAVPPVRAAVSLNKFEATAQTDGSILVVWETATELDTVAFRLYRSESAAGPWTQIVSTQAAHGDAATGWQYNYQDTDVTPGVRYYYYLEELLQASVGDHAGPISAGIDLPAEATATMTATPTPTATTQANSGTNNTPTATATHARTDSPTATRQFTNTPRPTATATGTRPASVSTPVPAGQATPTPLLTVVVATATRSSATPAAPILAAPAAPSATLPPPALTAPPLPTLTPEMTITPTEIIASGPPSTSTPQIFESVVTEPPPLLGTPDRSGTRSSAAPADSGARNTRLVLLLGGGAIGLSVVLSVAALLIWRARSR